MTLTTSNDPPSFCSSSETLINSKIFIGLFVIQSYSTNYSHQTWIAEKSIFVDKNSPIFYYFFSTQDLLGKMSDIRSFFNAKPKKTVGVGDGGNGSTQISPHDAKPKVWTIYIVIFFYPRVTTERVHCAEESRWKEWQRTIFWWRDIVCKYPCQTSNWNFYFIRLDTKKKSFN